MLSIIIIMYSRCCFCLLVAYSILLAGCAAANAQPLPTLLPLAVLPDSPTLTPTPWERLPATFTAVPTWLPSPTPLATATLVPVANSPTPDAYEQYTVDYLASRAYGQEGALQIESVMAETAGYTRYLITYPSDGLRIYGFMNVPKSDGPLAVVLVLHGYWPPAQYNTLGYTAPYANAFAEAGFITIHPNYRNHPPSDQGTNPFRIGYAVDVLNLLALVRRQAGQVGALQTADPNDIHLFGHSMGGGIALRVLVAAQGVETAVLYGAMSGDEARNYERIRAWSNQGDGEFEMSIPAETLARISPIYHLDRVTAQVSIHHGEQDVVVPPAWSAELCEQLRRAVKLVECFTYAGQPHSLTGASNQLLIERAIALFGG
jgi:dipeptidyl aminopeptidase/acylaminoacyl peptidase